MSKITTKEEITMSQKPSEETFEDADGLSIFFRAWRPAGQARAVVVINHGVNSHGGQYLWAGEQLVDSGFAVYVIDMRGRGKSEGERFYIDDVADYVADLAALASSPNRGNRACRFSCSVTARAGSCPASTLWRTRLNWPV